MVAFLILQVRGELGLAGSDAGEVRVSGDLQTKFKLFKKDATIKAEGYIKIITPAFTNVTIMGVTIGGIYH